MSVNQVQSNFISNQSITTEKIAASAVNADKIADGSITTGKIADSNVTTAKIADSNVTTAKIADSNVTTAKIADSNVTTDKIADSSITTAKIADSNVTTAKIADSSITTAKIADSSITTAKIADDAVTAAKIAAGAVGTSEIATDAVTTAKIANSNVTAAKIADSSITTAKIADSNVTTAKIADSNVTTAKIADDAVTAAKIAAGAVGTSEIATDAVTTAKIANSNVTAAKLADDVSSYLAFPIGGIVIWSGTVAQIPAGWYLCDGGTYGGIKTPDLRNRFIIGAAETGTGTADSPNAGPGFDATTGVIASNYKIHNVGGETAHQLTIAELASHTHPFIVYAYNTTSGGSGALTGGTNNYPNDGSYSGTTSPTGGDKYHENRPPYYALAYIMKCEFKAGTTQNIATTTPTLQELRLNGPLYDQEMDGGAQKGNEGDVLISLGDGNGVRWQSQINLQTEQTYASSGNSFTGIPSWAKRITIMFDQISINSASGIIYVQLLPENVNSVAQYESASGTFSSNGANAIKSTSGFIVRSTDDSSNISGHMVITKMGGNKWISSHSFGRLPNAGVINGGGRVTISTAISKVMIYPDGNGTFDNGSFNIMYE